MCPVFHENKTFSIFLPAITLIGLLTIPKRLKIFDPIDIDDENSQLLKSMGGYKKRRAQKRL